MKRTTIIFCAALFAAQAHANDPLLPPPPPIDIYKQGFGVGGGGSKPSICTTDVCIKANIDAQNAAYHTARMLACDKQPTWLGVLFCRFDNN